MAKKKQARHRSALKAHRQSLRHLTRNRLRKKHMREATRAVLDASAKKDATEAAKFFREAASAIDKASKAGTIHWKAAARKKARLAKRMANQLTAAAK